MVDGIGIVHAWAFVVMRTIRFARVPFLALQWCWWRLSFWLSKTSVGYRRNWRARPPPYGRALSLWEIPSLQEHLAIEWDLEACAYEAVLDETLPTSLAESMVDAGFGAEPRSMWIREFFRWCPNADELEEMEGISREAFLAASAKMSAVPANWRKPRPGRPWWIDGGES